MIQLRLAATIILPQSITVPMYILVYSTRAPIQVRTAGGGYCSFHREYHICSTGCDGHYVPTCLGSSYGSGLNLDNYNGIAHSNLTSKLLERLATDDT